MFLYTVYKAKLCATESVDDVLTVFDVEKSQWVFVHFMTMVVTRTTEWWWWRRQFVFLCSGGTRLSSEFEPYALHHATSLSSHSTLGGGASSKTQTHTSGSNAESSSSPYAKHQSGSSTFANPQSRPRDWGSSSSSHSSSSANPQSRPRDAASSSSSSSHSSSLSASSASASEFSRRGQA